MTPTDSNRQRPLRTVAEIAITVSLMIGTSWRRTLKESAYHVNDRDIIGI